MKKKYRKNIKKGILALVLCASLFSGSSFGEGEEKSIELESYRSYVELSDIQGHWAEKEIRELVSKGIVNGYEDRTFRPDRGITVEEFAKLIVEALSEDSEIENSLGHWFNPYEKKANSLGILSDISLQGNRSQAMTRYQVAEMLSPVVKEERSINMPIEGYFLDEGIFRRHKESIHEVSSVGLFRGLPDGTYSGRNSTTRAEAVIILSRLLDEEKRVTLEEKSYKNISKEVKPIEVPILMYHHFTDNPTINATISQKTARNHIEYVLSQGYEFIGLNELYSYLKGEEIYMPNKPIVLTADDGYLSVYEQLYPLAQEYNVMMSLAPVGFSIGNINSRTLPRYGWEHMRRMKDDGLAEYQNHTFDLHYPDERIGREGKRVGIGCLKLKGESFEDYRVRLLNDWSRLEGMLEENLGVGSNFMFYPYGRFTDSTELIAREMFKGSLSVRRETRTYSSLEDLWSIPRYNMCEESHPRDVL